MIKGWKLGQNRRKLNTLAELRMQNLQRDAPSASPHVVDVSTVEELRKRAASPEERRWMVRRSQNVTRGTRCPPSMAVTLVSGVWPVGCRG